MPSIHTHTNWHTQLHIDLNNCSGITKSYRNFRENNSSPVVGFLHHFCLHFFLTLSLKFFLPLEENQHLICCSCLICLLPLYNQNDFSTILAVSTIPLQSTLILQSTYQSIPSNESSHFCKYINFNLNLISY